MLMVSFFGLEPAYAVSLSVYLHLGTGLAASIYFRGDLVRVLRRDSEQNRRFFWFLVVATVTTGVVGFPLFLFVRMVSFYGEVLLALTGVALVATGLIQRRVRIAGFKTSSTLSISEGFILGFAQGFSVIPGLSRSGLTTSVLLLRNFTGEEAFRTSFLMSVPAVLAASLGLMLIEGPPQLELSLLVALAASFFSALLSIDILLRLARRTRFWKLCIMLGALTLLPLILYLL